MALINCPECGNEVSEKAPTCPKCGTPIAKSREEESIGTPLSTIQETSKKLKSHIIKSSIIIILGLILLGYSLSNSDADGLSGLVFVALPLMIGGLAWLLTTKFRIWWHHK